MIKQNEIGKEIVVNSGCDLTDINTIVMKMRKPDGTLADWIPVSNTTETYTYKTQAGDLDQCGKYVLLETQYTFVNGEYFRGEMDIFLVAE